MRSSVLFSALSLLLLAAGCDGPRERPNSATAAGVTSSTAGGSTPTPPSGTTPDLTATITAPAASEALMAPDVVALAIGLAAGAAGPVELTSLTVTASGSVDESAALGEVKLIGDDNGNGQLDAGEPELAVVAAPAFAAANGTVVLTLANPITIAAGATLHLLVTVDASAVGRSGLDRIGETVALSIEAAGDLDLSSSGQPVTSSSSFPLSGGPTILYLNDHLLFSEIVASGYSASPSPSFPSPQYIEIFNPTARTIDLSNYYLTDTHDSSTTANPPQEYYNLPTGRDFGPPSGRSGFDFVVRFPAGSEVASGEVVVVALEGTGFQSTYGQEADFCLRYPTAATQQMLSSDGATPPSWVPVESNGSIYDTGERVLLFHWDGQSDLVQDVDYVYIGSFISDRRQVDKTGVTVNGVPYLPDTPGAQQAFIPRAVAPNNAIQRLDFTAQGMTRLGGNGITGFDATSEPMDMNFDHGAPNPGTP